METEKTIQFDIAKLEVKLQEYALLITKATNSLKNATEPDKIDRLSNKILAYKAAYDVTTKELDALKLKKMGGLKDWSPSVSELKPAKKKSDWTFSYANGGGSSSFTSHDYIVVNTLGSSTSKTIYNNSHTHTIPETKYVDASEYLTYDWKNHLWKATES